MYTTITGEPSCPPDNINPVEGQSSIVKQETRKLDSKQESIVNLIEGFAPEDYKSHADFIDGKLSIDEPKIIKLMRTLLDTYEEKFISHLYSTFTMIIGCDSSMKFLLLKKLVKKGFVSVVNQYEHVLPKGRYLHEYGESYYNNKQYDLAFSLFMKSAQLNYIKSFHDIGYCYRNGEGVAQDYNQSFEWYRKAAEQDHARAQCQLGFCYYHGQGVDQHHKQAFEWFRKAAEQGNARSQFNLGVCYENGEGVAQDDKQAFEWYRKAAEQGHIQAQKNNWKK